MQTNKIHYHVLAGFHGCLPESNNGPFTTLKESRAELKEEISELRDSGNTLVGDLKHGYFELSKKTTALCDYVSIEECVESDCFIDDPEDLLAKDLSKDVEDSKNDYGIIVLGQESYTVNRGPFDCLDVKNSKGETIFFSQGEDTQEINKSSGGKTKKFWQENATDRQIIEYLDSCGVFQK